MLMHLTGQQIRDLRKALDETMEEFARRLGVSSAAVCLWEQEKRFPNHPTVVKLNELWEEHGRPGEARAANGDAKPGKRKTVTA